MNIEVVKSEKNSIELRIDNLTMAEIIRAYAYAQGASFAVWRREHPSKPLIFKLESSDKTAKKVISDSVSAIKKDCDKIAALIKK